MKILIIRFSSIGDIVLTSPIIRCVKQQVKEAEVHYITKRQFTSILEDNPYVDKIYSIDKNVAEVSKELKKENYDFVVDLHHNLRSAQIKSMLGKQSKSFSKLNIEKWLMVNLRINKLPNIHIVDRYFETVKPLGVENDGKGLDYFIPKKDEVEIKTLPAEFQNGYIGFVIGAKFFTKQLPIEKIVSIIQKINQPVILLGGKEDAEKANWIVSILNTQYSHLVFNACGKYTLNQSASLVKQARKIITHDTGLMHIAAAFKKEIVSIWGNTIPEFGMYPYYGETQITNYKLQITNLNCRPCSKLGFSKCPKKHFRCMNEIDEEEIIHALKEKGKDEG
ncbi:MAG: glycosyltransferase family 9 protein [Bacteroidetes bacterium]|nr:glycosyltransferase family 9 protein [Bacteroidota bacterium]